MKASLSGVMCTEEARCVEQGLSSVKRRVMSKRSVRTKRSTPSERSTAAAGTKAASVCDKVLRCCNAVGGEVAAAQEHCRVRERVGSKRHDFYRPASGACEINCVCEWLTVLRTSEAGREKGKDKTAERPLDWYYFIFIFSPRQEGMEGMTAGLK